MTEDDGIAAQLTLKMYTDMKSVCRTELHILWKLK